MNIWFSSDFHYGHTNLVKGVSKWDDKSGCRDFKDLWEHDSTLVENINSVVDKNDTLYFLGDWSFGGKQNVSLFRSQINCENICLILGNHDHHIKKDRDLQRLFKLVDKYCVIREFGQEFVLFHHPIDDWENIDRGAIHFFGHQHLNWTDRGDRRYNVGIDVHPEFRPFHIDELMQIMKGRTSKLHNSR